MKSTKPRGGKIDFTIPEMFPLIENGSKYVTIRKHRKNGLEVGGILKVYLGNRFHGGQRYLGTAEILALEDILFSDNTFSIYGDKTISFGLYKDGVIEPSLSLVSTLQYIASKDGFTNAKAFLTYHNPNNTSIRKQIITFGNQSWLN